jgi:uncharacterized integral membrane protein
MSIKNTSDYSFKKPDKTKGMFKRIAIFLGFKGVVSLVILIIAIVFCFQNIESTSIQFLFWKILEISKLYLIIISMSLGYILGLVTIYYFKRIYTRNLSPE